ncbi:YqgE/AlgH family protein [Glycomyces sp. NRRL B-16210]|uniref:YqgE/AlgH family protein n=1 Tax=Glycomyces sp. NRRL B-16210 TaxID=1463821 RepID=UPI0004C193BA|nr:YqgE/AlgH family protein [Glycomyces sp. NRRL B-16210]
MASRETSPARTKSFVGSLLVATPTLQDPNFDRTVVIGVGHESDGVLGVVLNRATERQVVHYLDQWAELAGDPAVLFEGGPVQPDAAIGLGWRKADAPFSDAFRPVLGRLGTLDLSRDPDEVAPLLEGMRVFTGYAGWSPGQLEEEIEAGAWMVFDALPADPFSATPEELWGMVWRRQGGMLSAVAHYPADPVMN